MLVSAGDGGELSLSCARLLAAPIKVVAFCRL